MGGLTRDYLLLAEKRKGLLTILTRMWVCGWLLRILVGLRILMAYHGM